MKLKYADQRHNKYIRKKDFNMKYIENKNFNGIITFIDIKEILDTVSVTRPDNTTECLIDIGYKWIGIYPKNTKYCITVMYDKNWNLLQWYFDINADIYKTNDGIPYTNDLYLDIVLQPNGNYYLIDEDELEEAFINNMISKEEYNMAYVTSKEICNMLDIKFNELLNFTNYCKNVLI